MGQMATLADPKTSHENTALKGLSLDHIGNVIAHIRSLTSEKAASLSSLSSVSRLLEAQTGMQRGSRSSASRV